MKSPGRARPAIALLSTAIGLWGCGGGMSPSAPPPVVPPTPPPPVVVVLEGTVRASGSIDGSLHFFSMTSVGEVRARLLSFTPADSKLEITLCQGDIRVLNTCTFVATGFETDVVRTLLQTGTNTVYVSKRSGDTYQQDSSYRLELQHP